MTLPLWYLSDPRALVDFGAYISPGQPKAVLIHVTIALKFGLGLRNCLMPSMVSLADLIPVA